MAKMSMIYGFATYSAQKGHCPNNFLGTLVYQPRDKLYLGRNKSLCAEFRVIKSTVLQNVTITEQEKYFKSDSVTAPRRDRTTATLIEVQVQVRKIRPWSQPEARIMLENFFSFLVRLKAAKWHTDPTKERPRQRKETNDKKWIWDTVWNT